LIVGSCGRSRSIPTTRTHQWVRADLESGDERVTRRGACDAGDVEVRSDRRFRFDADAQTVWDAIGDVESYREWWPWLVDFEAKGLHLGDVWQCAVKPPLPYTLRFDIELIDLVEPSLITAEVTGDISGGARLEIRPGDHGSDLRLISSLQPTGLAFRVLATAARPVARYGHDWILDNGAAQFAKRALGQPDRGQ
jgi:uncharacterized protein YndB with AHSA1/START domain